MENKRNNSGDKRDELQNSNPISPEFFNDDPQFPSDETTGSGYSEAERNQHDGYNSGEPAKPSQEENNT